MSTLTPISIPKCKKCPLPARQVLLNNQNQEIGVYCLQHATPALMAYEKNHRPVSPREQQTRVY